MTKRDQVYTKVKKTIKQMLKLDHQGQVVTLAMMIVGIVMSRKTQLSTVSSEVPSKAKDQSIEMRMRRCVKDDLDVEAVYMPFERQILEALSRLPLVLVMDGSQVGQGCMVLIVGMLYQKRAWPIAWLVYKGKKGHACAERHIQALGKVIPLLPKESQVILLGDAECDTTEMLVWLKKDTSWQCEMKEGYLFYLKNVGFTQTSAVIWNVIGWWGFCYEEPIFLITTMNNAYEACRYYRDNFGLKHSSRTKRDEVFVCVRVTWPILLV